MCDFGKGSNFINIPKGVKTGIEVEHITPEYTTNSKWFRFHPRTNLSVYKDLCCPQKGGDIWRIKNQVMHCLSLEMYVMYESYVVGCCPVPCAVVPSLLTYVPTLFHLRQPCSALYSKEGVARFIQTSYMAIV